MQAYLWVKTFHLVFVMAWIAAAFYLPRILINLVEAQGRVEVHERLVLMGRRLYRFGHVMAGLAVALGLVLWLGYRVLPDFPTMVGSAGWMHAKLLLVALLFAHFVVGGRWLKGAGRGRALPSTRALRWFNEVPVLLLVGVVYLVIAKPF
ncbi:CopD family protein [Luteimonas sp. RC10]|uniref:CopD family protein n=1 Tax=Luteimonas sp. RC10 TaxID=2587035 RepID=UPI001615E2A2|nr:CopD family protein [Luteimonas sp. RC10]MBB3343672.1 putative membrane protein [Luteimonas sp. RC10]